MQPSDAITPEMIEAACAATILGEDEYGKPVHLEPREARCALEAALTSASSECEQSMQTIADLREANERMREALEVVRSKAGSHTVGQLSTMLGASDPGYAGIFSVANAALEAGRRALKEQADE